MQEFVHKPVMLEAVIAALAPRVGGRYADGTVGGGGHAAAVLSAIGREGWLYGMDRDGDALEAAKARLAAFEGCYELRRGNFSELEEWVPAESCDGVMLDLGVSSPQLDRGERGFSFRVDGPLDMRMDQRQGLTAADLVNEAPVADLARWFREYSDERHAGRIARAIERERALSRIDSTRRLAVVIEAVSGRGPHRIHPATRVFQALRMVVNDELGSLERGLESALRVLKPGGRLVVLTFHSGEDRVVKAFGRRGERDYESPQTVDVPELRRPRPPLLRRVARRAGVVSEAEARANARARSAQLRVFEKA